MADTVEQKLLPCPFCGGDELSYGWEARYNDEIAYVQCHSCDAFVTTPTEAEAITAWNTRAIPASAVRTPTEGIEQKLAEERAAFIRLLDAADRYNGVFQHDRAGLAAQHQGQLKLAVINAYRVLGIGRTEPHPPLVPASIAIAGEK